MGTGNPVNGNRNSSRAGAHALNLLAAPISGAVLLALADGPKRLIDLRRACGSPAQTTLRAYIKDLEHAMVIEKRRGGTFPGAVECELTPAGRDLLRVVAALERWLEIAPEGPLAFGSREAKAAIKALVDGWSSTMLRAFAARPLSLTELDDLISGLSYPSLERRLAAMKLAGQVRPCPTANGTKGKPYAATEWLRRAIAPLAGAAAWERRYMSGESLPIGRIDAEAALLLALPLLQLPQEHSGSCRLGIEMANGQGRRLAGAMAYVKQGRIATCSARLEKNADGWATGSINGWLHAVIDGDRDHLELGGDQRLARALVEALHETLFAVEPSWTR